VFASERPPGFYAEAGEAGAESDIVREVRDVRAASPFVTGAATHERTGAKGASAGFRFASGAALEVAYVGYASATLAYPANLVDTVTHGPDVSLLGQGGAVRLTLKYRENGFFRTAARRFVAADIEQHAMAGVGASFRARRDLVLRAEWDRYFVGGNTFAGASADDARATSVDTFWVGVQYRF
jgi:hypothetical protein